MSDGLTDEEWVEDIISEKVIAWSGMTKSEALEGMREYVKRKVREEIKPKKIMDSEHRKQLQLAYLEETKITNRCFEIMDTYSGRKPASYTVVGDKAKFERAPDWLRPIAALSFRIGVSHEDIRDAYKAGQRGDWDTVDMVLMAHEV